MKHLAELEIRSFRNVRPTKLVFRPGINVVLGRNAAGKTTLLNLLSIVTWGFDEKPAEAHEWSYVVKAESTRLRHVSRIQLEKSAMATLPPALSRSDEFEFVDGDVRLVGTVRDGRVAIAGEETTERNGPPLVAFLRRLIELDDDRAAKLLALAYRGSLRLDESLDYFRMLLELQVTGGVQGESSTLYPSPRGFRDLLSSELAIDPTGGVRRSPEFLMKAARVMGYEKGAALFDVESKTSGATSETTLRNLRFSFSYGKDTIFHESLSYGEKRLLAFFAIADASPEILIIDELVNGLHHEWIKACLEEIGSRQAFLTSQNPLLLDYLEFSSVEEVARSFVLCERLRTEHGTELVWRNPTEEEASDFFLAYESGIQRVSDILITKGFW